MHLVIWRVDTAVILKVFLWKMENRDMKIENRYKDNKSQKVAFLLK